MYYIVFALIIIIAGYCHTQNNPNWKEDKSPKWEDLN